MSTSELNTIDMDLRSALSGWSVSDWSLSLRLDWSLSLRPEWSDDRSALRAGVAAFADLPVDLTSVVPSMRDGFVSISHCPSVGGFVWSSARVGLDIEVVSRVRPAVVARVGGSGAEPARVWCALEASYKSLFGIGQPAALSGVHVTGWSELNSNCLGFEFASASFSGKGVSWMKNDLCLALAWVL